MEQVRIELQKWYHETQFKCKVASMKNISISPKMYISGGAVSRHCYTNLLGSISLRFKV